MIKIYDSVIISSGRIKILIIGTGIDIVSIIRIKKAEERWGRRFLERVFTGDELTYFLNHKLPHTHLAGRFAAKEATVKAFGTGFSEGITWKDIEVVKRPNGKPEITLHGKLRTLSETIAVKNIHISISHDGGFAIAQVILEN